MVDGGRVGTAWEGHGQAGDQLSAAELFSTQVFRASKLFQPTFLSQPPQFPLAFYLHLHSYYTRPFQIT